MLLLQLVYGCRGSTLMPGGVGSTSDYEYERKILAMRVVEEVISTIESRGQHKIGTNDRLHAYWDFYFILVVKETRYLLLILNSYQVQEACPGQVRAYIASATKDQ